MRFSRFEQNLKRLSAKFSHLQKHSVIYCSIVTGFACDHSPAEVFSVQSRSLSDLKCLLSSAVRPQAIGSAKKNVSANLASDSSAKDRPSRGPYMKFLPKQTAQVAKYTMKSRNKHTMQNSPAVGRRSQGKISQEVEVEIRGSIATRLKRCQYKMRPYRKQGRPFLFGKS